MRYIPECVPNTENNVSVLNDRHVATGTLYICYRSVLY